MLKVLLRCNTALTIFRRLFSIYGKAMKPKRTHHTSTLRIIRDALGMTQEKFAGRLGVPRSTIENIEMRRAPLDEKLIFRLAAFAGVVPESLRAGSPLGPDGRPYDSESFAMWRKMEWTDETANVLIDHAVEGVRDMLRATVFSNPLDRRFHLLNELLVEVDQFVQSEVKQRSLKDSINTLLEEKAERETEPMTLREIQEKMGDNWLTLIKNVAPEFGSLPPTTPAIFTKIKQPLFSRSVMFPTVNGQLLVGFGTRDFKFVYTVALTAKGSKVFALTAFERESFSPPVPQIKQGENTKAPESDHARAAISRPPRVSGPTPKTSRRAKA